MAEKDDEKKKPQIKEDATDKLVEAALRSHLLEYADKKSKRNRSLNDTLHLVNEHMSSFIIMGYDYNGNPLQCINVNTQQEADSLCSLVHKFVAQNSGPMG